MLIKKKYFLIHYIFFFLCTPNFSQVIHETRAVWIATNHRLDWPPPIYNSDKQKKALQEILDSVKSKNLNTVYFQVRSNGTVLFKSSYDPFSYYINGKNNDISYDPLKFAVEEAHKRGLEIHAWINVVQVFAGTDLNILNDPNHIVQRKPEWVIENFNEGSISYWLDPGLPEVREYISDMIKELVENYDVDGVHLDYIRYPGKDFNDEFSFNVYGNGLLRDEWRRKNITTLIELINKKIKSVKPYIKLGATPIGIYKNPEGMYGWEGFSQVYQDTRVWLKRGLLDYIAPQIYWTFNNNSRFDLLVREWVENSFGRNVIIGIGAYKPEVKNEIEKMIKYVRQVGAKGVAFFRYSSIKNYTFESFPYKSFPAATNWILESMTLSKENYPPPPRNLNFTLQGENSNIITLNWEIDESDTNKTEAEESEKVKFNFDNNIRCFALYSLPYPNAELLNDYLFDIIPGNTTSYSFVIKKHKRVNYYFALKSISKLWNESLESSNVIEVTIPQLSSLAMINDFSSSPILIKESNGYYEMLIYSKYDDEIIVDGDNEKSTEFILRTFIKAGKNVIGLNLNLERFKKIYLTFKSSNKKMELRF